MRNIRGGLPSTIAVSGSFTNSLEGGIAKALLGILIAFTAAELALILSGGVQIGAGNHAGFLPVVRRLLDPAYLPGDFGIELRLHHHRMFAWVVAGLAHLVGLEGSLIVLTHLGHLLLMLALLRLCRALGLSLAAFAVVAAALATTSVFVGKGYEVNEFIGNGPIMPPIFAHAFVMMSLAAVIHRKPVAALVWAGAVLLVHIQIGIIWLTVLSLTAFVVREQPTAKELVIGTAALLAISAPGLADFWTLLREGVTQGGGDDLSYIAFRMPHHFAPRGLRHVLWPLLYTSILGAWWWSYNRSKGVNARNARLLFTIALALIALSALHALDYHVLHWGIIAQVQFTRLTPMISVLGAIGLVVLLQERLPLHSEFWMWLLVALISVPKLLGEWQDSGFARLQVDRQIDHRGDWYDLCRWVKAHGPEGVLYVTPPGLDGFTALTERSTLVEFKINPDGGRKRDAWYQRLRDATGEPLPDLGSFAANKAAINDAYATGATNRLPRLAKRYSVRYAVLPLDTWSKGTELYRNASFRIIELSPDGIQSTPTIPTPATGALQTPRGPGVR